MKPPPEALKAIAGDHVTLPELRSSRRATPALRRQLAMYWCRTRLHWSSTEIGEAFLRDHTSVLSAFKRVELLLGGDRRDELEEILAAADAAMGRQVVKATGMAKVLRLRVAGDGE